MEMNGIMFRADENTYTEHWKSHLVCLETMRTLSEKRQSFLSEIPYIFIILLENTVTGYKF